MINKQLVEFKNTKPYYALGNYSAETEEVWFIFHGYGQLGEYFAKNFEDLANNKTYIIIPQAPSKFYNGFNFDRVGASWLTKNELEEEIQNNFNYLESVLQRENINLNKVKINGFAFSQGVSMLVRWFAHKNFKINKMVLWAGLFPKNLVNYDNIKPPKKLCLVMGEKDPLKEQFNFVEEFNYVKEKIKTDITYIEYEGGHKVDKKIIDQLFK